MAQNLIYATCAVAVLTVIALFIAENISQRLDATHIDGMSEGNEPTSALDPISTKHIEQKFTELKDKYTIVMVTHILRQAKRIADYVIFMYLGEIIEHGPTADVLGNPQHQLTKDYVGGAIS